MIEILRLEDPRAAAKLLTYSDPQMEKEEGVKFSDLVQFFNTLEAGQRENLFLAAALENGQIIGYVCAYAVILPPFGNRLWGISASNKKPEARDHLGGAVEAWARSKGIRRGALCCRSEAAMRLYAHFGFEQTGYLMEREF